MILHNLNINTFAQFVPPKILLKLTARIRFFDDTVYYPSYLDNLQNNGKYLFQQNLFVICVSFVISLGMLDTLNLSLA